MSDHGRRLPTFLDMRAWDVRNVDGTLVTTIAGLGQVLGKSPAEAARWVREREGQRAMPDNLIAEARQAR